IISTSTLNSTMPPKFITPFSKAGEATLPTPSTPAKKAPAKKKVAKPAASTTPSVPTHDLDKAAQQQNDPVPDQRAEAMASASEDDAEGETDTELVGGVDVVKNVDAGQQQQEEVGQPATTKTPAKRGRKKKDDASTDATPAKEKKKATPRKKKGATDDTKAATTTTTENDGIAEQAPDTVTTTVAAGKKKAAPRKKKPATDDNKDATAATTTENNSVAEQATDSVAVGKKKAAPRKKKATTDDNKDATPTTTENGGITEQATEAVTNTVTAGKKKAATPRKKKTTPKVAENPENGDTNTINPNTTPAQDADKADSTNEVEASATVPKKGKKRSKKSTDDDEEATTEATPKKKKVKKDPNAPKNPRNAWMVFCNMTMPSYIQANPGIKATGITQGLAAIWREMPDSQKKPFQDEFLKRKEQYIKEKEEYDQTLAANGAAPPSASSSSSKAPKAVTATNSNGASLPSTSLDVTAAPVPVPVSAMAAPIDTISMLIDPAIVSAHSAVAVDVESSGMEIKSIQKSRSSYVADVLLEHELVETINDQAPPQF
ncbi:high mobility group box 3, partial [Quaeritorhiza haematococci]